MKSIKIYALSFLFIGMSTTAQGQFWKKLKKKAEQKISNTEDKLINKLDKKTDKHINETLEGNTKNTSVTTPSTYSFSSSLEVKVTSNNGKSANIEFLLGAYSNIYAISIARKEMGEANKMYNIITPDGITLFMDASGMKIQKKVPKEQFSQSNYEDKVPDNADNLKKTGATKTILGFPCYEYKYVNNEVSTSIWVTNSFPNKNTNISMLGMHQNGPIKGFVLEIDVKSSKETSNIKAIKYNKSKHVTINTGEYKSLGF